MNRNQAVRWLHAEIPTLIERGVLNEESGQALRAHYGEPDTTAGRRSGILIFAVLGALLIGSGVIALLAENWKHLPPVAHLIIAYAPLLVTGWLLLRQKAFHPDSLPWREGLGLAFNLFLGACIGITTETFDWHPRSADLILLWSLLSLGAIYLAQATSPAILFFAQIIWWSVDMQNHESHAVSFWMLLLLIAPFVVGMVWKKQYGARATSLLWALTACLTIGVGVTLERVLPGLWIIIYSALFAAFLLSDEIFLTRASPNILQRPLRAFGIGGTLVMALILSYQWPWERVGWANYRINYPGFHPVAAVTDYVLLVALPALVCLLLARSWRRLPLSTLLFSFSPMVAIIAYPAASLLYGSDYREPILDLTLVYNAYALTLGVCLIARGMRTAHLPTANAGLAQIALLALLRFFDDDIPFMIKGTAFIVIGAGFLGVNAMLMRSGKKREAGQIAQASSKSETA